LHRLGGHRDVAERKVLALVAELVLGETLPDHVERLVGPPERLLRVEPEHRALARHRPCADDQLQPAAGQDVHGGRVLGHPERVVQRQQQHVRPQPDHRRPGGHRGQQRELGRVVLVLGEVMLGQPPAAEPQLLAQHRLVEHLPVDLGERPHLVRVVAGRHGQANIHWPSLAPGFVGSRLLPHSILGL
jgi:hypothetical protein